jgi:hypothetical protein
MAYRLDRVKNLDDLYRSLLITWQEGKRFSEALEQTANHTG